MKFFLYQFRHQALDAVTAPAAAAALSMVSTAPPSLLSTNLTAAPGLLATPPIGLLGMPHAVMASSAAGVITGVFILPIYWIFLIWFHDICSGDNCSGIDTSPQTEFDQGV